MRVLAQRIEFAGEELIEVGLGVLRVVDDDGIRREIAEPLRAPAEIAGQPADEIEQRAAYRRSAGDCAGAPGGTGDAVPAHP